jgi:hypothetical protein
VSYDLFFRGRGGSPLPVDERTFRGYFERRKHYKLSGAQASYRHEDTGVYFSFQFQEDDSEPAVSFNLNYSRPHIFGLEAEPEVDAFVQAFSLEVSDPQTGGMGDGAYSSEGFLRGWNAGNKFARQALGTLNREVKPTLPAQVIDRCWRWNLARAEAQEDLSTTQMLPCFVPKIVALRQDGVRTAVVWGGAMAVVIPPVDGVLLVGDQPGVRYASLDELTPLLEEHGGRDEDRWMLAYTDPPAALKVALATAGKPVEGKVGVAWDEILDEL